MHGEINWRKASHNDDFLIEFQICKIHPRRGGEWMNRGPHFLIHERCKVGRVDSYDEYLPRDWNLEANKEGRRKEKKRKEKKRQEKERKEGVCKHLPTRLTEGGNLDE